MAERAPIAAVRPEAAHPMAVRVQAQQVLVLPALEPAPPAQVPRVPEPVALELQAAAALARAAPVELEPARVAALQGVALAGKINVPKAIIF